ncbi:tetratricopeptide repeat protein [Solibacillus silvestris]|uniref:tetratricopeptide repeat protein n=1 Tax=Solibacillus silvestris TaxID=76853 RepID=UPI003F7ECC4E
MEHRTQFIKWLKKHEINAQEKWLEQFESATNGLEQSIVNIALLYKQYEDFACMYNLLENAVASQNADAMYELANCYFEALDGRGNEHQAFTLYEKAALLGHCEAMNNLADMYLNGEATEVDEAKALYWFEKAAQLGVAEAMFTLGLMHEQGIGTDCNEALAFAYYHCSAKQQDVEAMYRLGMIFFSGELGQRQDGAEAVKWFLKASEQFHVDAIFNLGYCYEYGCGVDQHIEKAIYYYKQASLLGDIEATKKAVTYYERIDRAAAMKWQEKLTKLENESE